VEWKIFVEKFMPSTLSLLESMHSPISHYAATQMVAYTIMFAADNKQLESKTLKLFLELFHDTDASIRKAVINNMKFLIPKVDASEVERLFFVEVTFNIINNFS
jgi:hypothetical protein